MNSVTIRKRLTAPIPELPELTPLVGKTVQIVVLEVPDPKPGEGRQEPDPVGYDFWHGPILQQIHEAQGTKPITSIDELRGADIGDSMDGFEEAVKRWRHEPWSRAEE